MRGRTATPPTPTWLCRLALIVRAARGEIDLLLCCVVFGVWLAVPHADAAPPPLAALLTDPDGSQYIHSWGISERDYCPAFLAFSSGSCTNANNAPESYANYYGEVFGADSFCAMGSILRDVYVPNPAVRSMCVQATCNGDGTVTMQVDNGATATCTTDELVVFEGFSGHLVCPNVDVMCTENDPAFVPQWAMSSTPSPTPTISTTPTVSETPSPTATVSESPSPTPTVSETPSPTPTISETPSLTPTISETPTPTPTMSKSTSRTPTVSDTPSPSVTATSTPPPTATPTSSVTPTVSVTPTTSPPPHADCVVGAMSEYGPCVLEDVCDETSGMQVRSATISTFPVGDGTPCPDFSTLTESRSCVGVVVAPNLCDTTCADGVMDGDETGIDCGGSCATVCSIGMGCATDDDCQEAALCGSDSTCISEALVAESLGDSVLYVKGSLTLSGVTSAMVSGSAVAAVETQVANVLSTHGISGNTVAVTAVVDDDAEESGARRVQSSSSSVSVWYVVLADDEADGASVTSALNVEAANLAFRVHLSALEVMPELSGVSASASATLTNTDDEPLDGLDGDDSDDDDSVGLLDKKITILGQDVPLYVLAGAGVVLIGVVSVGIGLARRSKPAPKTKNLYVVGAAGNGRGARPAPGAGAGTGTGTGNGVDRHMHPISPVRRERVQQVATHQQYAQGGMEDMHGSRVQPHHQQYHPQHPQQRIPNAYLR